jgi:hypothetical protein
MGGSSQCDGCGTLVKLDDVNIGACSAKNCLTDCKLIFFS